MGATALAFSGMAVVRVPIRPLSPDSLRYVEEIEAEFSGTILEILVENGKPVEYGDKLFRVTRG